MMFGFTGGMFGGSCPEFEDLGSEYRLVLEVGGLSAEDISLEVRGMMLSVRGSSKDDDEETALDISCKIPADVNCECIMAELEKDTLTIVFPKAEAKVISITTVEEEKKEAEPEQWELKDFGSEYRVTHKALGAVIDDISVEVEDGKVFVTCTKPGSKWAGTFGLPSDAPVDAVFASIEDDKLTVVFPKYKGKKIAVVARGASSTSQPTQSQGGNTPAGSETQEQDWIDLMARSSGQ